MPSQEWKLKNYHEKWYAGEVISVGIGQGALAVTPVQLARTIGGIASGGVFKRPHVVESDQLPADFRQALYDSYPGSGDVTVPLSPDIWETVTDGMAAATMGSGTAHAAHLEGIDFAGKTGTAQIVNHSFGDKKVSSDKASRSNAWFVGFAPRRNPDIVVAVIWEHGGWGAGSAPIAARVIEAYVNKQRRLAGNAIEVKKAAPPPQPEKETAPAQGSAEAKPAQPANPQNTDLHPTKARPAPKPKPKNSVDVGAVWSNPAGAGLQGGKQLSPQRIGLSDAEFHDLHAGHFTIPVKPGAGQ